MDTMYTVMDTMSIVLDTMYIVMDTMSIVIDTMYSVLDIVNNFWLGEYRVEYCFK